MAHILAMTKKHPAKRCAHTVGWLLATILTLAACASADGPTEVEVVGDDYSYEGLPESIVAGTTLTLRNDSAEEVHELVAIRLDDDERRGVDEIMQLPPEELDAVLGSPSAVLIAPPDEVGNVVLGSEVFEDAGRYALFCAIPTDADPDEYLAAAAVSDGPPDVPGGPPHFVSGMWAELVVTE
jgi:uncharacterized cupredoxin-like copper-binding protein